MKPLSLRQRGGPRRPCVRRSFSGDVRGAREFHGQVKENFLYALQLTSDTLREEDARSDK